QLLGQSLNSVAYPQYISRPIKIRKLSETNVRTDFFEPDEIEAVISFLPEYLQDYVRFAHITGWRRNEISSLQWEDVSVQHKIIRLNPENSKTGESRILVLTGALLELMKRREQIRVVGCPYVFHRRGQFIRDFRKAWSKATESAGCSGRVFHSLRRSSVRDMIRAGVHERVAMSVSGHRTRSVFDRYNITAEDDIRQALTQTQKYREEAMRDNKNDT
ncbi:MAG: integrase, partial [Candidatus Entotheonella gemina]